jgi:uncharacterized phage infection (PIP) family protein YhgE
MVKVDIGTEFEKTYTQEQKNKWEEFKTQLTDEELIECTESVIEICRSLLTLEEMGFDTKILSDELNTTFKPMIDIQDFLGSESNTWIVEKTAALGLTKKFNEMEAEFE